MKSIFVSTPVHGQEVTGAYWSTTALLTSLCRRKEWSLNLAPHFGTSDLVKARNIDVHKCLKSDATHFLTFDADQATDEQTLLGLLESPWPITAAPVRKKSDQLPLAEAWNFICDPKVSPEAQGDYIRVLLVGAGCMCVWRSVLEDMCYRERVFMQEGEPIPDLYSKVYTEQDRLFPQQVSEDYGFCLRARLAGYDPYLYVPGKVKHLGWKVFEGSLHV